MTDRPHSCRQSPNGRHRFTVSPLMCDYCARTVTYLTDMGWNAPAVDPDWVDQEADVNDTPRRERPRCPDCGSDDRATNGWCITCRYGDSPKH